MRNDICLLKGNDHYDGCTSFRGFLNRGYYCIECDKGYNTEEFTHHSCQGRVCRACSSKECPDWRVGTQPTYRCDYCNFLFFGPVCLMTHRARNECHKYKKCPKCQQEYAPFLRGVCSLGRDPTNI